MNVNLITSNRKVAEYFNEYFSKPKSKLAEMDERITFVTPPVVHQLNQHKSLHRQTRTTKSFSFLLEPSKRGVSYRRGFCMSCPSCKDLDFLKCSDKSKGQWKYSNFIKKWMSIKNYVFYILNETLAFKGMEKIIY